MSALVTHEDARTSWPARQIPHKMTAGKTRGARDQHPHRSATMVTGEPRSRSRPIPRSVRSAPFVTANCPTALCSAIGSTNCRRTVDDPKVVRRKRARHVGLCQHAIRFGLRAQPVGEAAAAAFERGQTPERREVDDDAPARDATEFGDARLPIRSRASARAGTRPRRSCGRPTGTACASPRSKVTSTPAAADRRRGDGQHLGGCVEPVTSRRPARGQWPRVPCPCRRRSLACRRRVERARRAGADS